MDNTELKQSDMNEALRAEAVNRVGVSSPNLARQNPLEFIKKVASEFINVQLDNFPLLCEITRTQNYIKWGELKQTSNKGQYTDSYGWSEKRTFKFDYEIPEELYLFMVNLVYKDFWSNDNERIWRRFMKKICDGCDSMETLIWVKKIYGSNSQKGIVLN